LVEAIRTVAMTDTDTEVRRSALYRLPLRQGSAGISTALELSKQEELREDTIRYLGMAAPTQTEAVECLRSLTTHRCSRTRDLAYQSLMRICSRHPGAVPTTLMNELTLARCMEGKDPSLTAPAIPQNATTTEVFP
jgi:hypothetical protein